MNNVSKETYTCGKGPVKGTCVCGKRPAKGSKR